MGSLRYQIGQFEVLLRAVWGTVSGSLGYDVGQFEVLIFYWIFPQVADSNWFIETGFVPRLLDYFRL
jgi:hypothetical protein